MNNLRELRKSKRLTQAELANFIGISQNNYSYWENEKVKIDNQSLQKLADYFNVSVDYLLGREEKEKEKPSTEAEGIAQRLSEIINNKYSKDELKSITDDDLNLISDIFIDTVKNVKKYKK